MTNTMLSEEDKKQFEELVQKHDQLAIDKFFLNKLDYFSITLNDIKYMVSLGANPRADNDKAFVASSDNDDTNIPLFFLNECGADINARNGAALSHVLGHWKPNKNRIDMLFDNGIVITDETITEVVREEVSLSLKYLLDKGADPNRVTELFLGFHFSKENAKPFFQMLKYLSDTGVDFNQIIQQYVRE